MIENPILSGFCPDPSIVRVGDDYYIATSTFEWWPGVRLFHSRDLKHWRQIPSPLRRMSQLNMLGNPNNCGIWAPCLSYCGGLFFLAFTDVKTQKRPYYNTHNYLVYTDNICGEWSDPIYINSSGFDPSLFHDDDGKKYYINMRNGFKGILVQEYDHAAKRMVGSPRNVFPGTKLGFTEGPHLYKHGGMYYLMVAEGGTSYEHCVTVARSKNIFGPYEVDPQNPILTSRGNPDLYLQKAGHASLVGTQHGEWFLAHLCARPVGDAGTCVLGRETALQRVRWTEDGWLRLENGGNAPERFVQEPAGLADHPFPSLPERDDFEEDTLPLHYSFLRVPPEDSVSLRARPGFLRLYGREAISSCHHVTLAARRQTRVNCDAETVLEFAPECPEQVAGLMYLYNNQNFYLLAKTADDSGTLSLTMLKGVHGSIEPFAEPVPLQESGPVFLRVEARGGAARFWYSFTGTDWKPAGPTFDVSMLSDEKAPGFTGAHFALYCHDMTGRGKAADFDFFSVTAAGAE